MNNYEQYCEALDLLLRDRIHEVQHLWDPNSTHAFVDAMAEPVTEVLDWCVAKGLGRDRSVSRCYMPPGLTIQLYVPRGERIGYWNYLPQFEEMFPQICFCPEDSYERAMALIETRPKHDRRRNRYHDDY